MKTQFYTDPMPTPPRRGRRTQRLHDLLDDGTGLDSRRIGIEDAREADRTPEQIADDERRLRATFDR